MATLTKNRGRASLAPHATSVPVSRADSGVAGLGTRPTGWIVRGGGPHDHSPIAALGRLAQEFTVLRKDPAALELLDGRG